MKKHILLLIATLILSPMAGQERHDKRPIMTFEKTTINIGTFPAEDPVKVCKFVFTNTGEADLYIHQAFASCGCTVPTFPQRAIHPGESDTISVRYDGTRKSPGNLRKSITIHNNSKDEMIKLYITGRMLPAKEKEVEVIEFED